MQALSRRKLAQYVAAQLYEGANTQQLVTQVAAYLVERKRVNQVELLIRDIESLLAKDYGHVAAHLISARELSVDLVAAIEAFVRRTENAKTVEVSKSVDPTLLGGIIINTPNARLDASVRAQITALKA